MVTGTRIERYFSGARDVETFPAGTTIFKEGESPTCMYVVKEGTLSVTIDGKQVTTLQRGDIFGEMSLLDRSPRSATVTATNDCILVPIDERRFLFLVQETPFFALEVMKVIANRLRDMSRLL